jgi:hypothetical protein
LATSFEKNGKPQQATLVRAYLADNRQSGEDRVLDGIQFPIPRAAPITDFFFVKDHLPKGMKSNSTTLNRVGKAFFDGFHNDPTFTLTTGLTQFRLAGGEAVAFQGTALGTSGKKKGFAFYVLLGPGNTEWQFEFRTDGRRLNANSTLFWWIANSLRFI